MDLYHFYVKDRDGVRASPDASQAVRHLFLDTRLTAKLCSNKRKPDPGETGTFP